MTTDFNFYLNRQGVRGRKGEQGEQGYSPTITVKSQTANEYVLRVQNEDGSFDTPNLRGNAIANNGGTYIRYNPATEEMYTGDADLASTQQAGVVFLSTYEQLIAGGSENLIPTSQDVYNFVSQQIISGFVTQQEFDTYTAATAITLNNLSTQKLSFADLSNAIVAGNNITLSVDSENNTITINATGGDLSNYVTLNTNQTISGQKEFTSSILASGGISVSGASNPLTVSTGYGTFSPVFSNSGLRLQTNMNKMYLTTYNKTLDVDDILTSADLSNLVTTDTAQTITNAKTFDGNGVIHFSNTSNGVYFEDSSSTERIRIFTARHSSGTDYSDLTMQSYSDMQFRLLSPATTVKLTDIITASTLANSAIQPADLTDYAKLNQNQFFTELQNFSGGISLPTGNSINFHSPTTGSAGTIYSPSSNTLQIRANTININSGGSSPIVKNLFDMIGLSDLSIASTSSNWLNYDNSTGEFSANVDTVATQNSNNLITSDAVYDGLETKQNTITDLSSIRSGAELGSTSEQLENKVSSIDGTSSDTEYPSAKCVYDNLETKADVSQTHALKGYSDNGELLTDAEGLADVTKYAHSTFDRSKFTVVGSPNITDDGIASGFSSDNYIVIQNEYPTDIQEININIAFRTGSTIQAEAILGSSEQYYYKGVIFGIGSSTKFYITLGDGGSNWYLWWQSTDYIPSPNTNYKIQIHIKPTSVVIDGYENGIFKTFYSKNNIENRMPVLVNFLLGRRFDIETRAFTGSIDLKQFSITVDGVEVFNGNKTGIDTIKPDDYTVVGTPTISADGVASGFSSGNYILSSSPDLSTSDYWSIQVGACLNVYPTASENYATLIASSANNQVFSITISHDGKLLGAIGNSSGNNWLFTQSSTLSGSPKVVPLNQKFFAKWDFTGSQYRLLYSEDGVNWQVTVYYNSTSKVSYSSGYNFLIGANRRGNTEYFHGSIDLNSFKIYVDGNLVYQPCLKIPYTLSKTGSKIVQSVYRDRVNDMAEQFGCAPYYTLSDTDFTLPQVELYGLIGNKTLRDSYYNGVTYWELFSNRRLEQGGTCVSGVEYTLPKPFADANYVLTIPYSSKTATSFIPSATGDFIAKGMGLL